MIYIFDGVKGICQLPGLLCSQCGECCKKMNCKPITDCCNGISECCTGFTEKPLCSFVIISYLMVGTQLYFAITGLGNEELPGAAGASTAPVAVGANTTIKDGHCVFPDDAWVDPTTWLYGQMGFAVLGLLFAPYFQSKVWNNIKEKVLQAPPPMIDPMNPKAGKAKVPKKDVQDSFKQVFLEDFGVLFYFMALIGQLVWSWKGQAWIKTDEIDCHNEGNMGYCGYMGMVFFATAFLYTLMWYCCACCAGSVTAPNADGNYRTVDQSIDPEYK